MRIFAIDDEAFALSSLTRQLTMMGHTDVTVSHDAGHALATLAAEQFDLVISDLRMPDLDGIEFIRHLARLPHRPALILVSGTDISLLAASARLASALHLPVLGTVQKPVLLDPLRELIARLEANRTPRAYTGLAMLSPDDILDGIAEKRIVAAFQPKVSMRTQRVLGAESLARWRNHDGTILPPSVFIPVAEANGLMPQLTRAIIDAVFADMQQLSAIAPDLKIGLNVSADDLNDVSFADELALKARDYGIPPERVVVEVTESKLMDDIVAPLDVLSRLRLKNFGLSIDDFGTGAASFQRLQLLPFTELKIDRSFVFGATESAEARAILEAILHVARAMRLSTVAEGIECAEEWELLAALGCDMGQGYHIARPMMLDAFLDWHHRFQYPVK